jgi:peptidyl-prolyl isomerase D
VCARACGQGSGPSVGWTSGALFDEAAADAAAAEDAAEAAALRALRYAPGNPRVFLDVEIKGAPARRVRVLQHLQGTRAGTERASAHAMLVCACAQMEFMLFMSVSPRAAENFLAMCRGDRGVAPRGSQGAGTRFSYEGATFYRILDHFIDQTGVNVPSVFGGSFDDDAGGLQLKHNRPGLLSMANAGRNTNTNHFSILLAPAPHLDGSYTIFGECVRGMDVVRDINALATPSGTPSGRALIVKAGQLS